MIEEIPENLRAELVRLKAWKENAGKLRLQPLDVQAEIYMDIITGNGGIFLSQLDKIKELMENCNQKATEYTDYIVNFRRGNPNDLIAKEAEFVLEKNKLKSELMQMEIKLIQSCLDKVQLQKCCLTFIENLKRRIKGEI